MNYSGTSFLAWCLNHYFYNGVHHTWTAGEFYPYRQSNPKSSNPLLIYTDLYQPWKDADPYDKFITQHRVNLRKAVLVQAKKNAIAKATAKSLKRICDKIEVAFFYPIVYQVDCTTIPSKRKTTAGSGTTGSNEVLIEDLREKEFAILFLDHTGDADFDSLKKGLPGDILFAEPILQKRC